jgi:hypothetical protein
LYTIRYRIDKQIPNSYPQLQGKIEAYNKIVKNEFLAIEDIPNIDDGKIRYDDMFIKAYNETGEHGRINGLTASDLPNNSAIFLSENIDLLKI